MEISDRLKQYIRFKRTNNATFQRTIGVSNSFINNISKSIGAEVLQSISRNYPDLNIDWLLDGQGEMILEENDCEATFVNVLPLSAQGGKLNEFATQIRKYDCERAVSPIDNAELALTVSGDSMYPEYPNGSRIYVRKINEKAFFDWGKTYVLDTCNGIVIKKVFPGQNEGSITCHSVDSKNYPDFEIKLSDVFGCYLVLVCMSLK